MPLPDGLRVFDGHTDVPSRLFEAKVDLSRPAPDRHVDLPRLRQGGVGGAVFALFVPASLDPEKGLARAEALHAVTVPQLRPQGLEPVTTVDALKEAAERGAVRVVFGLENGRPLSAPGAWQRLIERPGVRIVALTHEGTHEWCDAVGDDEVHGGLTARGEEVVREFNLDENWQFLAAECFGSEPAGVVLNGTIR